MSEQPLIQLIDAFTKRHSMAPVTFGRKALNDPHLVGDIRNGRRLWPETEKKVRTFIAQREASPEQAAA
jgi:hypothetical protein